MADTNDGDQGNTDTLLKNELGGEAKPVEGETKPVEGETKPVEGEAKPKEGEKKLEGAPGAYEGFKLPEGTEVNEELMGEFTTLAKEMNLPQESAQKLIDLLPKQFEAFAAKQAESWKDTREGWVKDIKEDKELGGEKFDETLERANRVLRNFGSDGLKTFLADSGFGDSADLIRMLSKLDKALGEDYVVNGDPSGAQEKGAAETLYGNQGK